MGNATLAIPHFLGGEISDYAQGRFDKPDYRVSLNVCVNSFPVEIGPWTRRPGTMNAGFTQGGGAARVISFEIEQQAALTAEFTDRNVQFRMGSAAIAATLTSPYTSGSWASIRAVQAETTMLLLTPTIAPQALVATTLPTPGVNPVMTLNPAIFNDGPYLDPFTNGVLVTPGAKSGLISLTLSFPLYSATTAYAKGAFVTNVSGGSGINYVSLVDQNEGNTPASSPSQWAATSAGAAINNGQGFLGTDVGRLVRLFSEPPAWAAGSTYAASTAASPVIVSYNPTGAPGASTYWSSLVSSNTGHAPGSDLLNWQIIPQGAAIWSWGKIVGASNIIDRGLAGSSSIGNMTGAGGINAVFDGNFTQTAAASAQFTTTGSGLFNPSTQIPVSSFVGKNYSASPQAIQSATVFPSADAGFAIGSVTDISGNVSAAGDFQITFNLRGSGTPPSFPNGGTIIGTSGPFPNPTSAVAIPSSDQSTVWNYVWVEQVTLARIGGGTFAKAYSFTNIIGQLSLFSPTGTGIGQGITVELLGPPLLYTTPIQTWRLGVYTANVQPTCGTYNDGRLYLGGAIGNRFDACFSNGITGGTINFAPTDQYGVVTEAHAISYTFNSKGVNPILWMKPDLQGIKAGTQKGEWLIQAPTAGPISPLNITARQVTSHGSANIEPVEAEHTLIFVQRFGRKLLEYFPDVFSGKFSAPNLADKAQHIVRTGIAELAYTSAVNSTIWGRCTDGSLFSISYKRDSLASSQPPTYYAWARHPLGSGGHVESICAGPSVGGNLDALTMVVADPTTGIRHVEILTDLPDEETALTATWFLDNAVRPSTTPGLVFPWVAVGGGGVTFNNIPYFNNAVVTVFAAGLDLGDLGEGKPFSDFPVLNGSITVPYADGISAGPGRGLFTQAFAQACAAAQQFVVGYTYNSDGQLVRPIAPADTGARNGPALGKIKRVHRIAPLLSNTLGISFGTAFSNLRPSRFMLANQTTAIPNFTTYSGVFEINPTDQPSYDGMICWRVSRPWPATVVAIAGNLETADQ